MDLKVFFYYYFCAFLGLKRVVSLVSKYCVSRSYKTTSRDFKRLCISDWNDLSKVKESLDKNQFSHYMYFVELVEQKSIFGVGF